MSHDPESASPEAPLAGRAAAASLAAGSQALRPACRAAAASLSWLLLPAEPAPTDFRLPVAGLGEREAQIVVAEIRQGADVLLPPSEEDLAESSSSGAAVSSPSSVPAPCPHASDSADLWLVALSVAQASFLRALREADEARRHARFWEERGHRLARLRFAWLEQGPLHAAKRVAGALAVGGERVARAAEGVGRVVGARAGEAAALLWATSGAPGPRSASRPQARPGSRIVPTSSGDVSVRPDPSSAQAVEARALAARARLSRLMVVVARIQEAAALLRDARPSDESASGVEGVSVHAKGSEGFPAKDEGSLAAPAGALLPSSSSSSPRSLARSLRASAAVAESMRRIAVALDDLAASGHAATASSEDSWGAPRDRAWNASSWERALRAPNSRGAAGRVAKELAAGVAAALETLGSGRVATTADAEAALATARRALLAAASAAGVDELVVVLPASSERASQPALARSPSSSSSSSSFRSSSSSSAALSSSALGAGTPSARPAAGAALVPPPTAREALVAALRAARRAGRARRSARDAACARLAQAWAAPDAGRARALAAEPLPSRFLGLLSSLPPSSPEYLLRPAPQTVPPSRLSRGWIRASLRACACGAAGAFLYRHSALSGSDDLTRWSREARDAVRGAFDEHVHKPLVVVSNELFDTFRRRPAIVSMDEYLADRESLARMLVDFQNDHGITTTPEGACGGAGDAAAGAGAAGDGGAAAAATDASTGTPAAGTGAAGTSTPTAGTGAAGTSTPAAGTGAAGADALSPGPGSGTVAAPPSPSPPPSSALSELTAPPLPANCSTQSTPDAELLQNLRTVMLAYETQLRHVFTSVVTGSLARCLLIQVQKLKVDVESAMLELDQILRANELTTSLMAAVPAIAILVGAARLAARTLTPPKPDPAATALPARLALQHLEGALENAAKTTRDADEAEADAPFGRDASSEAERDDAKAPLGLPGSPSEERAGNVQHTTPTARRGKTESASLLAAPATARPPRVLAAEGAAWLALADAHAAARRAFFPGRFSPLGGARRAAAQAEWNSLAARLVRLAVPQRGDVAERGDAEADATARLADVWERRAVAARRIGGGYSIYNAF